MCKTFSFRLYLYKYIYRLCAKHFRIVQTSYALPITKQSFRPTNVQNILALCTPVQTSQLLFLKTFSYRVDPSRCTSIIRFLHSFFRHCIQPSFCTQISYLLAVTTVHLFQRGTYTILGLPLRSEKH